MKTKNENTKREIDPRVYWVIYGSAGLMAAIVMALILSQNLTSAQNIINAQKANLTALQTSLNAKEALLQNQSKLLNLSVNTTLFNSSVYLAGAYNTTLCYYNCYNFTKAGNYTLQFNISHAGYLSISTPSSSTLNLIAEEVYASGIPTNYENYNQFSHSMSPTEYITAELNATTSPVPIPVLPGKLTLIIYNYNYYPFAAHITIKYVN